MNFSHVADKFTRNVLEMPAQNTNAASFGILVDEAREALLQDIDNLDIPFEVIEARERAFDAAYDAYRAGLYGTCHKYLRDYWNV